MEDTNAFSPLNHLIMQQQNVIVSPTKQSVPMNDKLMEMVRNAMQQNGQFNQQGLLPQTQTTTPQDILPPQQTLLPPVMVPSSVSPDDFQLKASPSASSDMSSSQDGDMDSMMMIQHQQQFQNQNQGGYPLQQLTIDSSAANIANGMGMANTPEQRYGRHETWLECFTTTRPCEYEALLFSVYVSERNDKNKCDGWTYFDCLHRLQSKCRYKVRAKKQEEIYIVEEKGVHNHGAIEPIGQPGSHAGLPKSIREIVDRSYNDNWSLEDRTIKVNEEIQRLGLPANPRLSRQIDNRVAYLRRVKNLHESRRIQDQVNGYAGGPMTITDPSALQEAMLNPAMLQALMDQNGGKLTVQKDMIEKILGQQTMADLVSKQEEAASIPPPMPSETLVKPVAMNPSPEFFQFLQQQQQMTPDKSNHAALLALAQQNLMGGQENMKQQ